MNIDIQSFATEDFVLEHLVDSKAHRRMADEDAKFVYSHVKPRYDQGCVFMYMYV